MFYILKINPNGWQLLSPLIDLFLLDPETSTHETIHFL